VRSNRELLEVEFDTLWLRDDRGRLIEPGGGGRRTAPYIAIGAVDDGWVLGFAAELPEPVVGEMKVLFADEPPAADVARPPRPLARCEKLLRQFADAVEPRDGPTYLVPAGTRIEVDADIVRSSDALPVSLRCQDLELLNWAEEEWKQLLDGELGPWAFVMDGDRVVSICHSARLTDQSAEAGTWTDPDYRGQGFAAAATGAWGELLAGTGRTLFYSTWSANVSSQRVAERLGLPLIGWTWTLSAHEPGAIAT